MKTINVDCADYNQKEFAFLKLGLNSSLKKVPHLRLLYRRLVYVDIRFERESDAVLHMYLRVTLIAQ